MHRFIFVGGMVVLASATQAAAGCYDYSEPTAVEAPRAEICLAGSCGRTVMTYECANATSAQVGYKNGWSLVFEVAGEDVTKSLFKNEHLIANDADVSCREIDRGACRFAD